MTTKLSIDIGGTFTDVVLAVEGQISTTKVLTTYDDPALGVMQGVTQLLQRTGVAAASIDLVLHGTTLATNALIERRGAVTGLLTTQGHRDVLEMAFENRFEQYDVNIDRPEPLVPRRLRYTVPERITASGGVLLPLDESAVRAALADMRQAQVTSIAVGLLHSYANPEHEQRIGQIIADSWPEVSVTLSSQVCPEIREYERFSTTVANAYVRPLMDQYLNSLAAKLLDSGIQARVLLMTSGGGLTTLETAARFPIRLVESGPAGGAILAAHLAQQHAAEQVISFDMGGTTAKICLIDDAQPLHSRAFEVDRSYRFKKGSGLPVRIPVIEMVEIGAGGGSLASVDALRRIQVGPESAGSEPGPMCYGRGGQHPAVTDADVCVGRLRPEYFAGGSMALDASASRAGINETIAQALDIQLHPAAFAVLEIVEENMAAAARAHASEWGKNLSSRTMIAFGGAAPLHAATLANKLKIRRLVIPAGAGVGSALGFLLAPIRFEVVRSFVSLLAQLDLQRVSNVLADMYAEAAAVLEQAGISVVSQSVHAYMRYAGQGYEVAVPVDADSLDITAMQQQFERVYQDLYGRTIPNVPVEILSWTMALAGPEDHIRLSFDTAQQDAQRPDLPGTVTVYDGDNAADASLVQRDQLVEDHRISGPALIIEAQTTIHVPETMQAWLHPSGDIVIESMA